VLIEVIRGVKYGKVGYKIGFGCEAYFASVWKGADVKDDERVWRINLFGIWFQYPAGNSKIVCWYGICKVYSLSYISKQKWTKLLCYHYVILSLVCNFVSNGEYVSSAA
jgi:hypothetical protein